MIVKPRIPDEDYTDEAELIKSALNTKIDLVKYIADSQTIEIKDELTSDYVFGRFQEDQKNAIADLFSLGTYGKTIFNAVADRLYKWEWDETNDCWTQNKREDQRAIIRRRATEFMNNFLIRPAVMAKLSINKKDNPFLRLALGTPEDEIEPRSHAQEETTSMIKELLKNEDKK